MTASDKTKDGGSSADADTQPVAETPVVSGWTLQGEHEWDECSVQFSGSGCYHTIYEPGRRLPVAFVIGASEYWRDSEVEDTARARLIAAAPELLAALQNLCDVSGRSRNISDARKKAQDAISKATGDA